MDYISIFATSSYENPVGLCCGGKIFFPAKKFQDVCWEEVRNALANNRQYLRASDRKLANRTLGQTVFVARCDIPQAPMLKSPGGRCNGKKGILRTGRSHHTTLLSALLTSAPALMLPLIV